MTETQFLSFITNILKSEKEYNHKCEVAIEYFIHKQRIFYQAGK